MIEREHLRTVAHRLAVLRHAEEVTRNVSLTCRYYGITRTCFYRWKRRYAQLGDAGLRDRSSSASSYRPRVEGPARCLCAKEALLADPCPASGPAWLMPEYRVLRWRRLGRWAQAKLGVDVADEVKPTLEPQRAR